MLRSLEEVKMETLKRWRELFIVIASTGKYGYALSHSLKDEELPKREADFGGSFVLLNSKMFKT